MKHTSKWKRSFGAYSDSELRSIRFRSEKEIDDAIDLCWSDPDLQGLPHDIADGRTLIIPADAITYFASKQLRFTTARLLDRRELSPEEVKERRRHAM